MKTVLQDYGVWLTLPDGEQLCVADLRLKTNQRGRHLMSGIRYRLDWLQHPACYALNPVHVPLTSAPIEWETEHIPAIIDEVLPGRWERAVRQRSWRGRADIDDLHAVLAEPRGAWRVGAMEILPAGHQLPALPSPVRLADLRVILEEVDRTETHLSPDLDALARMQAGSSAGGARPKVTVEDDGAWLAKFGLQGDTFDNPRVEHACLLLAKRCGLQVPESRIAPIADRAVLLVRRFDVTPNGGRLGLISANAFLKHPRWQHDPPHAGYEDIVDIIRQFSVQVEDDLKQLYAQMLFNEAINNRDDHLKNFSFLLSPEGTRLSPAYDLVPSEAFGAYPQLDFQKSPILPPPGTQQALTAASAFSLSPSEAKRTNERLLDGLSELEAVMDEAELSDPDRRFLKQRLPSRLQR